MSYVVSPETTWACLILLLAVHLGMNHAAVRAVRMDTLNRQRACLCLSHLLQTGKVLTPQEVSKKERIFERGGFLRWNGAATQVRAKIGVSLFEIVSALGSNHRSTQSGQVKEISLNELFTLFASEEYLLWYDRDRTAVLIAFKASITPSAQLQAWAHALLTAKKIRHRESTSPINHSIVAGVIASTLQDLKARWDEDTAALRAAGWDLNTASLETVSGTRINLPAGTPSGEKPGLLVVQER